MRILFVNPRPKDGFSVYGPSLGLCYLSSFLKDRGWTDITGIDLNIDPVERLEESIEKADLVGIYCSTKTLTETRWIASQAKAAGKITVIGGPHPSILPEEMLALPEVDYIILSEGEEAFAALLEALKTGSGFSEIDGFGYCNSSGELIINPKTRSIDNLDMIPFPDRGLFDFDYSKSITMCATRGCPYKCANCQPALSLQTCAFRMRSVENVLDELEVWGRGKYVIFIDNDLTVNRRWLVRFCTELIERKLDISWDCQGRANTLDYEVMCLMKKAGCRNIGIGVESGSQELLDNFLRKQLTLAKVESVLEQAQRADVRLHAWFIIGIPGETMADMKKTVDFATSHDFASVGFSIGTPWPGTTFHRVASENGWLLAKEWDEYNEKRYSMLQTADWGPGDIEQVRQEIIVRFRKKRWHLNLNDFIFTNVYWNRSLPVRVLIRLKMRLREVLDQLSGKSA